jgi:acyl-CoA synthetase (AMP-forming)/AMP-acid ligase II/acyl carrier protein
MKLFCKNIICHLKSNALNFPDKTAFIFAGKAGDYETKVSNSELFIKVQTLARQLQYHSINGKVAVLIYDSTLDFIVSFFACQYAGVIAVPVAPLRRDILTEGLFKIIKDSQASFILCADKAKPKIAYYLHLNQLDLNILATDLNYSFVPSFECSPADKKGTSFIQYTSGSTADPKGVIITHENLISNQEQIRRAFDCNQNSIIFSWLPFHHDMGLVGCIIQSVYVGCTCILVPPLHFFQQPRRWIEAISHFKVTHSGGPNFAYDLCVETMIDTELTNLDLSNWSVAFNGSESVQATTITNFTNFFEPCGFKSEAFFPCYGLAEATLLVSAYKCSKAPTVISIKEHANSNDVRLVESVENNAEISNVAVSCGKVADSLNIKIISSEENLECKDLQYGEICISGTNVTDGYWNGVSNDSFIEINGKKYLKTGDSGFFYDGELFITGRIKELLIIRGKNHYPYEIERCVANKHLELTSNGVVVFEDPKRINDFLIVAELKRTLVNKIDISSLVNSIRRCVIADFGISPSNIIILKPRGIPRTTSGKLQRLLCKELYLKDKLKSLTSSKETPPPLVQSTKTELIDQISSKRDIHSIKRYLIYVIKSKTRLSDLDVPQDDDFEFNEIGIDSLRTVEIANIVNNDLNINLQASDIFKHNTFYSLIGFIEQMLWVKYSNVQGKQIIL